MFLRPFHKRRNAINPPQPDIRRPFDRFPIRFRFGTGVCDLRAGAAARRFRFFFLLLRSQFRKTRLLSSVFPPSSVYFIVSASIFRFHRIYFLSKAFPDSPRSASIRAVDFCIFNHFEFYFIAAHVNVFFMRCPVFWTQKTRLFHHFDAFCPQF